MIIGIGKMLADAGRVNAAYPLIIKRERGRLIQNLRVIVDYRALPSETHISRVPLDGIVRFGWNDLTVSDGDTPYVDSEALRNAFFAVETPDDA